MESQQKMSRHRLLHHGVQIYVIYNLMLLLRRNKRHTLTSLLFTVPTVVIRTDSSLEEEVSTSAKRNTFSWKKKKKKRAQTKKKETTAWTWWCCCTNWEKLFILCSVKSKDEETWKIQCKWKIKKQWQNFTLYIIFSVVVNKFEEQQLQNMKSEILVFDKLSAKIKREIFYSGYNKNTAKARDTVWTLEGEEELTVELKLQKERLWMIVCILST